MLTHLSPRLGLSVATGVLVTSLLSGTGFSHWRAQPVTVQRPPGTWQVAHSPALNPLWPADSAVLRGVHLSMDPDGSVNGWAVGDRGRMARYDGRRWQPDRSLEPAATSPKIYHFRDVFTMPMGQAWAVGVVEGDKYCESCGFMAHFTGDRWRILDRSEFGGIGRVAPLNAIDMMKTAQGEWYGWAVGDDADFDNIKAIIVRYAAGRWRIWTGPNNVAKHLYDVRILSPTEAWAVGQDGSESWYHETEAGLGSWPRLGHSGVDTLYAVDLADPLYGWDGGVRGRMNRYAGGCHDDSLDTQCWFNNAAIPLRDLAGRVLAVDIYGIDLISRTEGWLVGAANTRQSTIAYLDGDVWRVVKVANDPGRSLRAIHMLDEQNGWAVGDDGVILQYVAEPAVPTESPTSVVATPTSSVTPSPSPTLLDTPTAPDTATATWTLLPPTTPLATSTEVPSPTSTPTATQRAAVGAWRLFLPFMLVERRGTR